MKDGCDKVVLNRDDAAVFRLDTTYMHKQHKILCEAEKPELATRTDFLNKYSSILQTNTCLSAQKQNQRFALVWLSQVGFLTLKSTCS